jgi:polyhydroxybutyrate depolymerase
VNGRPSLRARAAAALLVAVAAGCGGAATTASRPSPAPKVAPAACLRAPGHRQIAGNAVYIPRRLPARPPLLLVFHGMHETVAHIAARTGFDALARRHGFVVAYPGSTRADRWQLNHHDGYADIARVGAFIETAVARACADPRRVYLTGFSNGGGFTARAGCDLADQVAAIAPVSGSYRMLDPCKAGPMPTLEIHGRDPWLPTVPALIAEVMARNGCTHVGARHRIAPGIVRTRWPGCGLERVVNDNIGHEWPNAGPFDTSEQIWRFVRVYRR